MADAKAGTDVDSSSPFFFFACTQASSSSNIFPVTPMQGHGRSRMQAGRKQWLLFMAATISLARRTEASAMATKNCTGHITLHRRPLLTVPFINVYHPCLTFPLSPPGRRTIIPSDLRSCRTYFAANLQLRLPFNCIWSVRNSSSRSTSVPSNITGGFGAESSSPVSKHCSDLKV